MFIICAGCVINPTYEDPNEYAREARKKYPQNSEQILKNANDIEAQRQFQSAQKNQNILNSYTIIPEKTSGWSMGEPGAFIHLGHNTYKYLHKINMTLVCNLDSFLPTPFSRQKVKWKLSEAEAGEASTDGKGNLNLVIVNKDSSEFRNLELVTSKNIYNFSLRGHLLMGLKSEECLEYQVRN